MTKDSVLMDNRWSTAEFGCDWYVCLGPFTRLIPRQCAARYCPI